MNDVLLNAIFSIDSYNRGYQTAVNQLGGVNSLLGEYTLIQESNPNIASDEVNSGFYAAAYKNAITGEIIISYRGTDDFFGSDSDPNNGWLLGGGNIEVSQALLAVQFYREVVANEYGSASTANLQNANITLTGHSLGGGLAGYVAALYGKDAYIYDSMNYISAVAETVAQSNNFTNASPAVQNLIVAIYNGTTTWPVNTSGVHGYQLEGQVLDGMAGAAGQLTYDLGTDANLPWLDSIAKHDAAILTLRVYASFLSSDSWKNSAENFIPLLYDNDFAESIGATDRTDANGSFSTTLRQAIAYSAIDEGGITTEQQADARPFGDAAIRAFYDDANDLGGALTQTGGAADLLLASAQDITKIYVQFAGQLALNSVLVQEHYLAQFGVIPTDYNGKTFTIDLSDATWSQISSTPPAILNKQDVIDAILDYDSGLSSTIRAEMLASWGDSSFNVIDHVGYALDADTGFSYFVTPTDGKATLIVSGNQAETVAGTAGNDLILARDGNDILIGNQGDDLLFGGSGTDTADYSNDIAGISMSRNGDRLLVTDGWGNYDVLNSIENINGSNHSDILTGQVDIKNTLNGGAGDDIFVVESDGFELDGDTLVGGSGVDTLYLSGLPFGVTVNASGTLQDIDENGEINNFSSIENFVLTNADDTFVANYTGVSKLISVNGGGGTDAFVGGGIYDSASGTISDIYGRTVYKVQNVEDIDARHLPNYNTEDIGDLNFVDLSAAHGSATFNFWLSGNYYYQDQNILVDGAEFEYYLPIADFSNDMKYLHGTHNGDTYNIFNSRAGG